MKNSKALLISFGGALMALLMMYSYITQREKEYKDLSTPVEVFFSIKNIPQGTRLDETWVNMKIIPKRYALPGFLSTIDEVNNRLMMISLLKDTQILESMLSSDDGLHLNEKTPIDMRAFSIHATDVTAAGGKIEPGNYVDVLVKFETGQFKDGFNVIENTISKTCFQNILVLAVNGITSKTGKIEHIANKQNVDGNIFSQFNNPLKNNEPTKTVTLALSPSDTQKMNIAQEIGKISLSLRSRWDKGEHEDIKPINARNFLGIKSRIIPKSKVYWGAEERN